MIIKKPYAFMIKHFRLIHFILSLLMVFLISKTSSIVSFFNEYVKNGYYTLNSGSYINFYMFISIILIIVISAFVYLLMKWKNKSRNLYIFTIDKRPRFAYKGNHGKGVRSPLPDSSHRQLYL